MKLTVKYKRLRIHLLLSISFGLMIVRAATRNTPAATLFQDTTLLKRELRKTKKKFPKLELVHLETENGIKVSLHL